MTSGHDAEDHGAGVRSLHHVPLGCSNDFGITCQRGLGFPFIARLLEPTPKVLSLL